MSTRLSVHRAKEITIDTSGLKQHGWIDIKIKHEFAPQKWITDEITVYCSSRVSISHVEQGVEKVLTALPDKT